ncbi:hypothetical protein DPMN_169020 [Dreissena polymorpha]|uniref:Uncharacterized protein n=1 Tax=Dreissena polymorpha TaxID=45954 RepID=A0A9D4F4H4_DREPO|nr:hypothetical protein DPMN_169020 [Dreissena polymorpha]
MSASTSKQDLCLICKEEIEISKNNWVAIQWKGVTGINEASVKRTDSLDIEAGTKEHKKCRQHYTNDKSIKSYVAKQSSSSVQKRNTRQSSAGFESHTDCILCGCKVELDKGHFSCLRTDQCVKTIKRSVILVQMSGDLP